MEHIIYFAALFIFFAINLRILRAIHFENKFEKNKLWEIKAAYFLTALAIAHLLAEIIVRFSKFFEGF